MIGKADSVLGRSVLDFARAVDRTDGATLPQLAPVAGR
jgi:hypothetical protein